MTSQTNQVRLNLFNGIMSSRQLVEKLGVSQSTVSRALSELGSDIIRLGSARSIHYVMRDQFRGLPDIPVYRVSIEGTIKKFGVLIPVYQDGFVMRQENGETFHSDSIPWWILDMLPQGYLGRAYAARHAPKLGLPSKLNEWTDTESIRALLTIGHDTVGNLLLGDTSRDSFLADEPALIENKLESYAKLAIEASKGDIPGSSAGGEQPKFTAYAMTPEGSQHVLVKFSEAENNSVTTRWRDLLLAEHLALETLHDAGVPASKTSIINNGHQRFLEVERFDRLGKLGRRAVHSLKSLDAEFVGDATAAWPVITQKLVLSGQILPESANIAGLLWAFGKLIGNTDMHNGNLSFIGEHGLPFDIAPAYDMMPMAFAPKSGGSLSNSIPELNIGSAVTNQIWQRALILGHDYLSRMHQSQFSDSFKECITALEQHLAKNAIKISRLD